MPRGAVFLTVCLAERGGFAVMEEVERQREAVRVTRANRPVGVTA